MQLCGYRSGLKLGMDCHGNLWKVGIAESAVDMQKFVQKFPAEALDIQNWVCPPMEPSGPAGSSGEGIRISAPFDELKVDTNKVQL